MIREVEGYSAPFDGDDELSPPAVGKGKVREVAGEFQTRLRHLALGQRAPKPVAYRRVSGIRQIAVDLALITARKRSGQIDFTRTLRQRSIGSADVAGRMRVRELEPLDVDACLRIDAVPADRALQSVERNRTDEHAWQVEHGVLGRELEIAAFFGRFDSPRESVRAGNGVRRDE